MIKAFKIITIMRIPINIHIKEPMSTNKKQPNHTNKSERPIAKSIYLVIKNTNNTPKEGLEATADRSIKTLKENYKK
jgi:hypothetical protein